MPTTSGIEENHLEVSQFARKQYSVDRGRPSMWICRKAPDACLVVFTTRSCQRQSNKEITSALDISEATVKVHMTHILERLKVAGRTEAINVAVRRGLVRLDPVGAA
jgi:Bacterial regulatory proteins, luxR family